MTQKHLNRTTAVALKYDPEKGGIPTVAASGYTEICFVGELGPTLITVLHSLCRFLIVL